MKRLFLVDASNMFFRAFYAIRQLSNSKGMPTNALYGYLSMTVKLLREMKPDYMAYCFDSKEDGFREELYADYKANRSEMPEDLIPQMPYFTKIVEALGIPCYHQEGVEADDIIGTLATMGAKNHVEVTIVSGDKDFAQLIGPMVKMMDTMKNVIYDVDGVKEKWGIRPDQMIDYLSLIGDSSDNIPGVAGVGPKTALKLLDSYPSLDEIYKNIESVKPDKLREKMINSKDIAYLSQQLVTIKTDMDLKAGLEDLKLKPVHKDEMIALLNELDFKSFERKIFGAAPVSDDPPQTLLEKKIEGELSTPAPLAAKTSTSIVEKNVNAEQLAKEIKKGQTLWTLPNDRAMFVATEDTVYTLQDDLDKFTHIFNEKEIQWKGCDLKSFWKSLKLKNQKILWDHKIAAYVINPSDIGSFAEVYESVFKLKLPDFPSGADLLNANQELEKYLLEKLKAQNGLDVYQSYDLPLVPVLHSMETYGFRIDDKILKKQSEGLLKDIRELELKVHELAGETFNIASPKQLSHILFEKLKLTPLRKTKTGLSTDSDVLAKLEKESPIASKIIEYRELAKLKSTYVDSLPLLISPEDGRIHTVISQTVTTTGRLSSSNPNLQNIPIRTERGNAIRKAFIADDGCELISADYSQIELRILAHVTSDPGLVKAFENDLDIHSATASEVFNVKLSDVDSNLRRIAKAVNFGLAYGMSAHGLAENLGISRTEAADIISRYFQRFAKVKEYMTETVEIAKTQGYVESASGRRRYLPELKSKNAQIRNFGERAAINAPMQGTASDIVKKAMIEIFNKSDAKMILQVHDELVFEVADDKSEKYQKQIKDMMENVVKLKVPLKVNVNSGKSWFAAH
jgi:DNA polymerase-1